MTRPEPYEVQVFETPFHSRTSALCKANDWSNWSGYTTPHVYTDMGLEYFAARNTATLFDISPMTKYVISGPGAGPYLDRLLTRNLTKLKRGRVAYALWCNDAGMVIDDGTVFRMGDNDYRLFSQERHLPWLLDSAIGYNVVIEDVTDGIAAISLQGPTSCAVLKAMGLAGIENLKPYFHTDFQLGGRTLMVSRTGFTGDLGYELWIDPAAAEDLWDRLMEAGALYGLRPMGSAALNMTRIEAGFIQAGDEFFPGGDLSTRPDRLRSPFELGLGWLVDFDKGHFIGRRALLRERQAGSRYALVGLDIDGNKPAHHSFIYHGKHTQVGIVTSALWSPTCKRNIAIASLKMPYNKSRGLWADVYVHRELKWDRVEAPCTVVDKQFFNPPRRWATPAGDC